MLSQDSRDDKEQNNVDKTGRRKSSILRKLSRKSIPPQNETKNLQDEDDDDDAQRNKSNEWDGSKRTSNREQDEISSDYEPKTNMEFNPEEIEIVLMSTLQESEVKDGLCLNCEMLGEKCAIHASTVMM